MGEKPSEDDESEARQKQWLAQNFRYGGAQFAGGGMAAFREGAPGEDQPEEPSAGRASDPLKGLNVSKSPPVN